MQKKLTVGAICAGLLSVVVEVANAAVVYTDDMESLTPGCDNAIGDYMYREYQYATASCTGAPSLVYPAFDQAAAQLQDKFACTYYNIAGVVPSGDANAIAGQSLAIADHDENVAAACHRIQAAVELTTGATDLGEGQHVEYTFSADVKSNQYGDNSPDGSEVGILFVVLDVAAGYATLLEQRVPVIPATGSVSETFTIDLTGKSNILVQAGFYAQADDTKQAQAQWDNVSLSWEVYDPGSAAAEESAACDDTATLQDGGLDWDDPFGPTGKVPTVTCTTDTYTVPTDADWAGFGDGDEDDSVLYPLYFPEGGSVTFDCSTPSGTSDVTFKLENAPYPNNTIDFDTTAATCTTSENSMTAAIPAGEQVWTNMLLYVEHGTTVVVKNVKVNGNRDQPTSGSGDAAPIPALPLGGLLGLVALVGLIGSSRRRF